MLNERRSNEKIIALEYYTDGSLKKTGSTTFGSWGFILVQDNEEVYEASGKVLNTTNQRMELLAIAEALKHASSVRRPHDKVIIYSDSAYAINCYLKQWYVNWQNNGWVNSNGTPVANLDIWGEILPYFDNFWYSFKKVAGHEDNFWNNKCDKMVQQITTQMKINWRGLNNE